MVGAGDEIGGERRQEAGSEVRNHPGLSTFSKHLELRNIWYSEPVGELTNEGYQMGFWVMSIKPNGNKIKIQY